MWVLSTTILSPLLTDSSLGSVTSSGVILFHPSFSIKPQSRVVGDSSTQIRESGLHIMTGFSLCDSLSHYLAASDCIGLFCAILTLSRRERFLPTEVGTARDAEQY